jgi:CBS domain-containing protein
MILSESEISQAGNNSDFRRHATRKRRPARAGNRQLKTEEEAMTVKAILEKKGHDVFTLGPNEKLSVAIRMLADHKIGALVISNGDRKIVGILSERDIVRVVAKEGAAALDLAIRSAMTPKVKICNENHTVNEVMEIMTRGRFRHLPVEKDGLLDGIVSIGDVVKRRIEDVEREADEIRAYIATA